MRAKRLVARLFTRHRIEILMWALVVEMLTSPLADSHPRAQRSARTRGAVDRGIRYRLHGKR